MCTGFYKENKLDFHSILIIQNAFDGGVHFSAVYFYWQIHAAPTFFLLSALTACVAIERESLETHGRHSTSTNMANLAREELQPRKDAWVSFLDDQVC